MSGWIVVAYLAGVIGFLVLDRGRWTRLDALTLILWPIAAPTAYIVRRFRLVRRFRHWKGAGRG